MCESRDEEIIIPLEWCKEDVVDFAGREDASGMGGCSQHQVVCMFHQVASALAHCQAQGVYHLDVKPDNLLIAPDGTVKLCDFGNAVVSSRPGDPCIVRAPANGVGTTEYCAPEVLMAVDRPDWTFCPGRADVWSLGVTMLGLVTGRFMWNQASLIRDVSDGNLHFKHWMEQWASVSGCGLPDQILHVSKFMNEAFLKDKTFLLKCFWTTGVPLGLVNLMASMLNPTAEGRPVMPEVVASLVSVYSTLLSSCST
jgi:serine/threonine protein kinase